MGEATTKDTKNTKNCIFKGNNSRDDRLSSRVQLDQKKGAPIEADISAR